MRPPKKNVEGRLLWVVTFDYTVCKVTEHTPKKMVGWDKKAKSRTTFTKALGQS